MPTRDELLKRYDDACTELDRANLDAFMVRRRARLAGVPLDAEEQEALRRRRQEAERAVSRAEFACKAAGVWLRRPNTQAGSKHRGRAA